MSNFVESQNLEASKTAFFLCDMQEKFKPAIESFDAIVEVARRLTEASKILDIPLFVTEQYPKGLGHTVAELDISHAKIKKEKSKFTMFDDEFKEMLKENSIKTVVLYGVETHVCILQTAIDLVQNGFSVHLAADACSSRCATDRLFALNRLRSLGVIITTHEAVMFQLVADSKHPKFKEIQKLVLNKAPDTGLVRVMSSI